MGSKSDAFTMDLFASGSSQGKIFGRQSYRLNIYWYNSFLYFQV